MKRILTAIIGLLGCAFAMAQMVDGGEYYIVSEYYDMVLGTKADGSTPMFSAYGKNEDKDSYIVVAEKSNSEGYWYLRNKANGKYLAASTSDTWSVRFAEQKGSGNEYLWLIDVQFGKKIVNRKNTGTRLGCDWTTNEYVGVYYDKPASSRARFHVIPATGEDYNSSLLAASTPQFVSSIGTKEQDFYSVNDGMELKDTVDLHIISPNRPFATTGSIKIADRSSWVIFENVRPQDVIDRYLTKIKVNSITAEVGRNVRVAIYLDGAAVIPHRPDDKVLTCYDEQNLQGKSIGYKVSSPASLSAWNNRIRSFVLKRGFMATVATDKSQGGYTRVFVADHADLIVNTLPTALDERISSIQIRPWQYVSKKGWCSTQGDSGIADHTNKMKASWFYTWSADRSSTSNCEYVPIKQHIYWPSWSQINGLEGSSHVLGLNEPDHSEQHDKCDCKGVVDAWKATTLTPDFQQTGMRIGSPAPTDAGWLKTYFGHVDDMAYRCDFAAFHAYWGPNEANGVSAWYNRLKDIYDNTKRPIWLTEWAYGASWTSESWPSGYGDQLEKNRAAIMEIVDMFERTPFIERYAYYQWDTSSRRFINDDGWVTPAGQVYAKTKSTFSYNAAYQKVPNWWTPSLKTPVITTKADTEKQALSVTIKNDNGDLTRSLRLEHRHALGEWQTVWETDNRVDFDNTTFTTTIPLADLDTISDALRVVAIRLMGDSIAAVRQLGPIVNPDCSDGTNGWIVSNLSTNKGEASDGNAGNVYWDQWKANGLSSSMKQEVKGLPAGDYELCALMRAGTNVTLTLQCGSVNQNFSGRGNKTIEGSGYLNGWQLYQLPKVRVENGGSLTIGASATGSGSAWWSCDDFVLLYTPDPALGIDSPTSQPYNLPTSQPQMYNVGGQRISSVQDKGIYIIDGKKIIK